MNDAVFDAVAVATKAEAGALRTRDIDGQAWHVAVLVFSMLVIMAPAAQAALSWGNQGSKCDGPNRIEYARLWGLNWGSDWKKICERTKASGVSRLSDGKRPSYCVDKGGLGTWGEWKYSNHPSCGAHFEGPKAAGCFGPNRQVYSARLKGDLHGRSWEAACRATDGPNNLGKPDRCVKDAFSTGIWGEWYSNRSCTTPLKWGAFRDNGCVRDMKRPDANAGGVSLQGMRSYSAVLWNVGGDWLEACKQTPIKKRMPNGVQVDAPHPTACVIADANEALSWTTAAILGAGTAMIPTPDPSTKAALIGAAIGLGSKGAEELLLGSIDTGLNVWGIVWVEDASCGAIPPEPAPVVDNGNAGETAYSGLGQESTAVANCPPNANGVSDETTCQCEPEQMATGRVWGTDTYTADSSICAAAMHAGLVGVQGGQVMLRRVGGLQRYVGSTRNGVSSLDYGPWKSSFVFSGARSVQSAANGPTSGLCPANGSELSGPINCTCSANAVRAGQVWGTGAYTADSALCVAARHAGVVSAHGGTVSVHPAAGRDSYVGSTRNGVTTANYGRWGRSFEFE